MSAAPSGRLLKHALSAVVLAAIVCVAPQPASAGRIEQVPASALSADMAMPAQRTAAQRTWTQIVWDASVNRLARRSYTLWDPLGAQGLDLAWDGDAASRAADGPITGTGTLTWREAGSSAHDETARVATYAGRMRSGRPHGRGTYTHRSGAAYAGEWSQGLMDGDGRLFLPNGDQYSGGFAKGRPDGDGVYIDATGTVYAGSFADGERNGEGNFYPASGKPFAALWHNGTPVADTVRYLKPEEQIYPPVLWAQYQNHDDIRVGVLVDRTYYAHVQEPAKPPLVYTAENKRDEIFLHIDEQRVLDAWRGRASIAMTEDEEFVYEASPLGWRDGKSIPFGPGFLATGDRIRPVPVIVELRNDSDRPLRIVNAFLDVGDSRLDPEPAVQIRFGYMGDCGNIANFKADFELQNFGWTAAENASLRFSFANDPEREFSKPIGTIERSATADLTEELRQIGFPVDKFKAGPVKCDGSDYEACIEKIRTEVDFGPLTDSAKLHVGHMRSTVKGFLDYEWRDAAGTLHKKSSPFSLDIVLGRVDFSVECGEGGSAQERQLEPFDLAIDKQNYRIMIPLRDDIPPGVTGRWRIRLQAPKTSRHDFRVVFELSDGRQIASRPVDFVFFRPWTPM